MFKERQKDLILKNTCNQREVINSGGVSLNSDISLLLILLLLILIHIPDTFSRYFHLKYLVFVIIKKGEIVRTKFESTTLYLSFDDNKVKRYSIYKFHV